jgi:4-amino-4-deoxy-L-arabinose transferase-like glycosyltransferase
MALPLCALVVVVLSLPLLAAQPANLTSDESLYLAEAYNIAHGDGATYPSGDAVVHRAPLFPALLAPAVKIGGPDAAYTVTKAIIVVNALLVMLLAYRIGGALAGAVAGMVASGAAYLNELGTTLYLDPLECTFMLLGLLALHQATAGQPVRWCASAGAMMGLAFLAKEAAIQWLPLGVVAWLAMPALRSRVGAAGAASFTAAFAAVVAPWWAWVWLQDASIYLLGGDGLRLDLIGGAIGIGGLALVVLALSQLRVAGVVPIDRAAAACAVFITVAWGALVLYGLEAHAGWKADPEYVHSVPDYLLTVAPQAQPYFALALAWPWLLWRALRGDDSARLLVAAAALFMAFAIHAANRALQLRDVLPLVYISYVSLGLMVAWGVRAISRDLPHRAVEPLLVGALAALAGILVVQQAIAFRADNEAAASVGVASNSWDSEFVRNNAAWMTESLPEGSRILSSRLYFSSLHVNTGGRFRIHQLPTVRVEIDPSQDGLLVPASNLFRWGENVVHPYRSGDDWIYLREYPGKRYWIALSQQELMEYVGTHEIDYVALSGDDMTFSSLAYASYFTMHPAFELIYHERYSHEDQSFVYRVDRSQLGAIDYPLTTSASSFEALQRQTGLAPAALASKLGVPVRVSDAETGLTPREELAATSEDLSP